MNKEIRSNCFPSLRKIDEMQKEYVFAKSTASLICLEFFASDSLVQAEIYLKLSLKTISKIILLGFVGFCLFFSFFQIKGEQKL